MFNKLSTLFVLVLVTVSIARPSPHFETTEEPALETRTCPGCATSFGPTEEPVIVETPACTIVEDCFETTECPGCRPPPKLAPARLLTIALRPQRSDRKFKLIALGFYASDLGTLSLEQLARFYARPDSGFILLSPRKPAQERGQHPAHAPSRANQEVRFVRAIAHRLACGDINQGLLRIVDERLVKEWELGYPAIVAGITSGGDIRRAEFRIGGTPICAGERVRRAYHWALCNKTRQGHVLCLLVAHDTPQTRSNEAADYVPLFAIDR
ncbi:hypothetical protein C8J57DRAFT_1211456 [Mycena rebaudengoi]|nr:hypothetical protein C8J57DRAFT_1211456 [Mycena rebaudengoi]